MQNNSKVERIRPYSGTQRFGAWKASGICDLFALKTVTIFVAWTRIFLIYKGLTRFLGFTIKNI